MLRITSAAVVIASLLACNEYTIKNEPATAVQDPPPTEPPATEAPPPTPEPGAPDIEVDPMVIDFGPLPAQCPANPELVTVRNVGEGDLTVNDIFTLSANGFSEDGQSVVLAQGEIYEFWVDFTPSSNTTFSDAVRIASNDPDESELDVQVLGEGSAGGLISDGFTQTAAQTVDVLFVLDNSGSMSDNLNALNNQFPIFINNFLALGLDFQIGVVTTDMDNPAQSGILQGPIVSNASADPVGEFVAQSNTGSAGSGDERGLDAAFTALDPSGLLTAENAGMVRPGANLAIIVVSDEDDGSNMDPVPFANWLDAYHGDPDRTSISIVGGPKQGLFPCTSGFIFGVTAAPVPRYWRAARETGGIHANLCQLDFGTIVDQLSTVAAGLTVSHSLNGVPDDPTTIEVIVDGQVLASDGNNGWTYDPQTNSVNFHGAGVPDEGAVVDITYEGETVCNP